MHRRPIAGPSGPPPALGARIVDLTAEDLRGRLDEALAVYVAAMAYPPGTARQRASMWLEHSRRPGWRAVGALDADDALRGVAYGYPGAPGQWWFEEVRRGLSGRRGRGARGSREASGHGSGSYLEDYLELTELHVDPDAQGAGLGEALLRRLLARSAESSVLLSTPETDGPSRAWALYRRLGFDDVLRHHRFSSDPRPFAVLGRDLPLTDATPERPAP